MNLRYTTSRLGILLSTCFLFIAIQSRAQVVVKGQVKDNDRPLPGVSVFLKTDMKTGTSTDAGGNFNIRVPDQSTLVFKALGYETVEKVVNGNAEINVIMHESQTSLNEVVVVGYTSKQLAQVSSSVSVVSGDELNDVTSDNVMTLLQGKAAGVIVSNGSPGDPSSEPTAIIRGSGSISAAAQPLMVVDGIIGGTVDPNDVASVTILKDAAATGLYGSRAANGVIIITTKTGHAGKTQVRVNSSIGFNNVSFGNFKSMNSQQLYDFESTFFPADVMESTRPPSIVETNTNWKDLAFRTGVTQRYGITVSGGSENTQVYVSGNYYHEDGTLRTTGNEKYNLRANVAHEFNDKLKLIFRVDGSYRKYALDASGHYGALNGAINNMPFDNPYNEDGTIKMGTEPGWNGREHDNFLHGWQYNYDKTKRASVAGDIDLIYRIVPHLTFSTYNRGSYRNSKSVRYFDVRSKPGGGTDGELRNQFGTNSGLITSNRLQYSNAFGKHDIGVLAVWEAEKNYDDDNTMTGQGLPPGLAVMDVASNIQSGGGGTSENAFSKGLVQVDYNYDNRYFFVGSLVNEASSRFGADNRSANFFSVAGSWILSNEDFMQQQHIFNLLKVRASYGATGNAQIGDYEALGLYSYSDQYAGFSASLPSQLANNNLTWEKANTVNLGVDIGLFNRISLNVDVYDKTTKDLLLDVPLPYTSGYSSVPQNVGSVRNRGVEFNLMTNNLTGDFKWVTSFNISFNKNRVLALYQNRDIISGNQNISEGHNLFSWYMRKWVGVDPENGDPLWEKVTEDGNGNKVVGTTNSYNSATLEFVGKGTPDFTGGFNNEFSFKGFVLSAFFNFVSGNLVYNGAAENFSSDGAYIYYNTRVLPKGKTRWKQPGDIATEPKAVYGGNQLSNKPSSRFLEDGSYIRLRNVRLSYRIPTVLTDKINISNISVYVSGDNLWTGTKFTGPDPEVEMVAGEGAQRFNYPISKRVLFGLNIEF